MHTRKIPPTCGETLCNLIFCVNSVQDWVSNNGFKFCTSKTVCMHFCNQCKQYAEPSIMFDTYSLKVLTEAKFLSVIFNPILTYNNHVKYLKTNSLKTLDILKVVGQTNRGRGQTEKLYFSVIDPYQDLNWTMVVLHMGQP